MVGSSFLLCIFGLKWNNFICTRTFLALTDFVFYRLTVLKSGKISTTLNFRMMNEEILTAIFWSNKTKAF